MRKPVPPSQILAVTLRFLATGESYASLARVSIPHKQESSQQYDTIH